MPEPTVTVRMKEDKTDIAGKPPVGRPLHAYLCLPFHALILVLVFFRSLTMNQSLLSEFGDPIARVEAALAALRAGQGVLVADEVLAKHDENYMPPEVTKALKESGKLPADAEVKP